MLAWAVAGLVAGLAVLFLLAKFDFKKVLYFDKVIDIISSALLIVLFSGTFAGMMAAAFGGVIISFTLLLAKYVIGYKRLARERWYSIPRWQEVQPTWGFSRG